MSDKKNKAGGNLPEERNRKTGERFRLDLDDQPVKDSLEMSDNEIRSHSNGEGPVAPEGFRPPPVHQPAVKATAPGAAFEKGHKKRDRKKGKKNRWFFRGVWLAVLVLVGIGIASFAITCLNDMLAFQKDSKEVVVELKKGASTNEVADELIDKGVIHNKWAFCTYASFTKSEGTFEYGTFTLNTDMDYEAIINNLQLSGDRVETVKITFTEGMSVSQMGAKLEEAGVCTQQEFEDATNQKDNYMSYEFINDIKDKEGRAYFLEGYLFPDTYEFYKNEGAENAIEKMLNNTKDKLTATLYKKAEKANMSMDDVITMASMIQAEAANKKDMYVISSIFHNRLDAGVENGFGYLNSDPTIWYPYLSEEDMPEGFEGAYNTYTHVGLPVGPIDNPGLSAILAALEPEKTDYYYFCHDKDGKAYYAVTEAEHENNKAQAGLS